MRSLSETKPCTSPGWEPVREFAFESPVKLSNIFPWKWQTFWELNQGRKDMFVPFKQAH